MKDLFKAKELHESILKLDKDIIKLESKLDKIIKDDLNGSIELSINLNKTEKLKLDEDGSIVSENDGNSFRGFTFLISGSGSCSEKDESKEKYKSNLSETELILMFATLLRYKQDQRKSLINEFNKLSLKLKI